MTDRKFATEQISRMIGLDFFPSDTKAQKELVDSLCWAKTDAIAVATINEWVQGQPRRPTPADIRRIVADHNERYDRLLERSRPKCNVCDGTGMTVHHFLVSYRGKSFGIENSENIDHLDFEQIRDFRLKLGDNQTILSGARDCYNCRGRE